MRIGLFKFIMLLVVSLIWGHASANDDGKKDRKQWVELCYKIAEPVLRNMSEGKLIKNMEVEFSPTWDNRNAKVVYMEAFGRLMAGISPWLSLEDDNSEEGKKRKQIRQWALASYKNAVDPQSPDYLLWKGESQILVDAAYLAESFLRAPDATWKQLDKTTQQRYIECFKGLRSIRPAYNNWLLFRSMIECFLLYAGEDVDRFALSVAVNKMNEWYLSDGWYSDGPEFALDYYNSFVIHPMYVEIIEIMRKHRIPTPVSTELALKRMQRFNQFIERLISPEGTFPAFGRSVVYRMAAFQPMALSAWKYGVPEGLSNGQVRAALSKIMENMFDKQNNFNKKGYLRIGFAGHQPELANYYTNNGSLYMTSLVFMPLGLPESHPFWTEKDEKWTSQKAWNGEQFPIDKHQSLRFK